MDTYFILWFTLLALFFQCVPDLAVWNKKLAMSFYLPLPIIWWALPYFFLPHKMFQYNFLTSLPQTPKSAISPRSPSFKRMVFRNQYLSTSHAHCYWASLLLDTLRRQSYKIHTCISTHTHLPVFSSHQPWIPHFYNYSSPTSQGSF